ncbi:TPA: relaxase/mobilization nuclease domain-containing protein [Clostridioides difficile]|nr:relaxase/mobilization nuclease domain-containing protein [Clostridioides difficile]HBG7782482.1 relaxase/mobilization nuclease domain-containing protein [Clostridioides difficile]HDA5792513.1 relaxase/mobilization nuclease domain-containing protein [Clostridioides difficile]
MSQSLKGRFDYGKNPDKTEGGELISSYACDHMTADAEFLLSKAKYKATTGREQRRDADVLCYQIRQSFKPGEITPEDANRVGYETAMRWTKGKYAFFVATHTDRQHIHNHIYYNSTSLDCAHKFRDFIGSARAVRRLSDRVCLENDLSVIANPKLHSKGRFLHYGAWAGADRQPSYKERLRHAIRDALAKGPADFNAFLRLMEEAGFTVKQGRGGAISFLVPGQQRATRLRSSTLGEGYDPEDIRAVIAGKRPLPEVGVPAPAAPARVNLIVDIQERLRDRKGPAYERWAKIYNLKQMAAALQFMQEHGLTEYNQLAAQTEEAVQRFHVLTGQLRQTEANLAHTSEVMGAVVQYAKTRPVFDGYKATKYSKKYLAAHEAELADYRAAKAILNDLLDGARLPRMPELKEKRRTLAAQKKTLYADYRAAQQRMREAVAVKANIDHLLGLTDQRKNKEQER